MNPIIRYRTENQRFWKEKRDQFSRVLETHYGEIAPGLPLVDVRFKDLFLERCHKYYDELAKESPSLNIVERWDSYEITRMFGKGLNPTSLKTTLNNVIHFVENLKPLSDTITIVELGCGSGWSTIILKNELEKKFPNHKKIFSSIDISPHSIVATQNTLDYNEIPWQTSASSVDIRNIPQKENYINLVVSDFKKFIEIQEDNSIDGIFSSHGTAYLSEEEYIELLKVLEIKGRDKMVIVIDSLDPLYTVKLNKAKLLWASIFPITTQNKQEYYYGKSLKSNSKYFYGEEVKKLVAVFNQESQLFYKWNNYLIKNLRIRYLLQMMKSITITTDVIEEYREDVYPSYLIETIIKNNNLKYKKTINLPACPLYIVNAGFILEKNAN